MTTESMLFPRALSRVIAPVLGILITLVGAPLAVKGSADNGLIGSLSAAGSVRLRGVEVSGTGTLFSGDTVRTTDAAYARLILTGGHRIELGSDTDLTLGVDTTDGAVPQVGLRTGSLAFASPASSEPLSIRVEAYEIRAEQGSAGNVTFLATNQVGVRAMAGLVTVRNMSNGELTILSPQGGQEDPDQGQVITLDEPLDPTAVGQPSEDGGLSTTAIYALAGGGVGGLVLYLALRESASPN